MAKRRLGRVDQAASVVLLGVAGLRRHNPPQAEVDQAVERTAFWKT